MGPLPEAPRCLRSIEDVHDYDRAPTLEMTLHVASCADCRHALAITRLIRDAIETAGWWDIDERVWRSLDEARERAGLVPPTARDWRHTSLN